MPPATIRERADDDGLADQLASPDDEAERSTPTATRWRRSARRCLPAAVVGLEGKRDVRETEEDAAGTNRRTVARDASSRRDEPVGEL